MCVACMHTLGVFTCVFLTVYTRLGSYLLFLPPALPRTLLCSELSSGSFPLEQLCATLGAGDRLRPLPQLHSTQQCLTLPTTQSSKRLSSSPLCTSVAEAFLPQRAAPPCSPTLSPLPCSDPIFLDPKAQRFLFILFL